MQLQCTLSTVAKVRRKISLNVSIHHVHTLNLKRLLKYIANTDDHCSFYIQMEVKDVDGIWSPDKRLKIIKIFLIIWITCVWILKKLFFGVCLGLIIRRGNFHLICLIILQVKLGIWVHSQLRKNTYTKLFIFSDIRYVNSISTHTTKFGCKTLFLN